MSQRLRPDDLEMPNKPLRGSVYSHMPLADAGQRASRSPLRLWPGVAIVVVQWIARFAVPPLVPEFTMYGILIGIGGDMAPP